MSKQIKRDYLEKIEYYDRSISQYARHIQACKEKLVELEGELKTYQALLAVLNLKEGNIRVERNLKDSIEETERHIKYQNNQLDLYESNLKMRTEDLHTYKTLLTVLTLGESDVTV